MRTFLTLAALVALSAATVPAQAADDLEVHHTRVSYGDLNLRSAAGVATLRHRLSIASRNVCSDGAEMAVTADELACRNTAMAHALSDMRQVVASAQAPQGAVVASIAPN